MATRYIGELWRGELPLSRVFWTDMLVVGTLVNIATMVAAIALWLGGATLLGFVVHFLPVPYNVLLLVGLNRSAAVEPSEWTWIARALGIAWFIAMLVI